MFCSSDRPIFVCAFIERLLRGLQVPKVMDIKMMQLKRATMTYQILSDKNHCWEPEPETVPEEGVIDAIAEKVAGDTVAEKGVDDTVCEKGGGAGDTVSSIINDAIVTPLIPF